MFIIRSERPEDYEIISEILIAALKQDDEAFLVKTLRKSPDFIPELSLVAFVNKLIVGHILFSKSLIKNDDFEIPTLTLAPLAVRPEYQNQGIGTKLVNKGLEACKLQGHKIVNILGHRNFYPRFGFKLAFDYGIIPPIEEWRKYFFVKGLISGSLNDVKGTVIYPSAFGAIQ